MEVFLAGIIQGSLTQAAIHDQDWRTAIREALRTHCAKANVYCHFEANPDSITYDDDRMIATLAEGNRRAAASDVVVCWLPEASMGTAIEMYLAAQAGAVVLTISPMTTNWVIRACSDRIFPDVAAFEQFLAGGELEAMVARKRAGRRR
ncbi:MAG: hypothetical protein GX591_00785 [Planctomycetes bacterium]|nr:hypothetical protein [Planctomycetota bacterium]